MRLISTEHGQSFQPFIAEEIRPPSGVYLPEVLLGITERYAFAVRPPNYETVVKEGAKYKEGRLVENGKTIAIKDLGFFSDGIIVGTWNTDDSNTVLDDLIAWSTEKFGFREQQTKLTKTYTSSVVVEFEADLDTALETFGHLKKNVSSAMREICGWDVEVKAARIALATDPTTLPQHRRVDFTIERRVGLPYAENRYFSMATLPTRKHIELLEELERCWT
jgi:hypothetical protein